jgi:hypothetical protein
LEEPSFPKLGSVGLDGTGSVRTALFQSVVPAGLTCTSTVTLSPSGSAADQRNVAFAEIAPHAGSMRKSRIDGARLRVAYDAATPFRLGPSSVDPAIVARHCKKRPSGFPTTLPAGSV